jgi:transposase
MHENGLSCRKISKHLKTGKSSIHTWITKPERKPRVQSKCHIENQEAVKECIDKNPSYSIRDVAAATKISKSTVARILQEIGYSKKKTYQVGTGNKKVMEDKRKAFSNTLSSIDPKEVIAIDETCLYERLVPDKMWSPKGTRVYTPVQRLESKQYSLVTALSSKGVVHSKIYQGAVNTQRFSDFLEEMNVSRKYKYVLMDNVGFHKSVDVKKIFEKKKLLPVYTSPYSPEWNPVEMYFSYLKRNMRKDYNKRTKSLEKKVSVINNNLRVKFCKNWFKHVWNAVEKNVHRDKSLTLWKLS